MHLKAHYSCPCNCCRFFAAHVVGDDEKNKFKQITFTFREFQRRFYPKRLIISTFVRRKRNIILLGFLPGTATSIELQLLQIYMVCHCT